MNSSGPEADLSAVGRVKTGGAGGPSQARYRDAGDARRLRVGDLGRISRSGGGALAGTSRMWIGTLVAALVVLLAVVSGTVQQTDVTLVVMGFDPDRAQLITTLIVSGVAAAAATLVMDRVVTGALLGTWAVAFMFGQTFITETQDALSATGALGSFDLVGWIVTLVTLVVIGSIAAWAGATLAAAIRPQLIATGVSVREMVVARKPNRRAARRPVAAALILGLLFVTVPAFGSMVNLAPDSLMLNGGHFIPLAPGNSVPSQAPASPGDTLAPTPTPSLQNATPSPSLGPTDHARAGSKPWLAWTPSGAGHVTPVQFASPWTGGTSATVDVNVYTPPGYAAQGDRRYPVLYEAPTGLALWNGGTGVIAALDKLIDSGTIPASIVVFIDSSGAPYPDSECANSYDGKMWLETFISRDVVQYVDSHYKTMAEPIARGIMGMSTGGFCSAMLLSRHPDVYATSISFSGYYYAGIGSAAAHRPYGTQANMDAVSPALLVPKLTPAEKTRSYFVVVANPTQVFYGFQADNFEKILTADHVGFDAVKSVWVHSWTQVREEFPVAVQAWAARMVADGVW
jgi:enterochelin esterase-like enzyme